MKVLFWLEHHDWSCSHSEPLVKTVRKPSNVAPDVLLDCSALLMPSCKTWKPMLSLAKRLFFFLCEPKITHNCFLILRSLSLSLSLHHPHTPKNTNTSTHPHISFPGFVCSIDLTCCRSNSNQIKLTYYHLFMKQKGLFAATPQVDEHEFNVQLSFCLGMKEHRWRHFNF